jgi:cbb3-type cytochrome c oxidase subunit III
MGKHADDVEILLLAPLMSAVPTFAADGEAVFKARCVRCHGEDGKGKTKAAPPDLTDLKIQASLTDADIVDTITNGRKGTLMVGWKGKLSGKEISAVAAYVRSLGRSKAGQ